MMLLVAWLAVASPQAAQAAATWTVDGPPGAVRQITGAVRAGGRIVADRFVGSPVERREEAAAFRADRSPRGSCARAASARPFTRLRRFAADGRLLWTWGLSGDGAAVRLMAGDGGDCLSPDGGRLLLIGFMIQADAVLKEVDGRVLAVDRRPRFVAANGQRTGQPFGALRQMGSAYWRRGGDATLVFTLYDTATGKETPDLVVLGRRP